MRLVVKRDWPERDVREGAPSQVGEERRASATDSDGDQQLYGRSPGLIQSIM
jgi:hypothetical protein